MRSKLVIAIFVAMLIPDMIGTAAQNKPLAFEVARVWPTTPERQNLLRQDFCTSGGRFAVAGTPVMWSLRYAYGLKEYQVSGAPEWLNDFASAYDIEGKPSEPVNTEQCRLMVQSLFVDRFMLATH